MTIYNDVVEAIGNTPLIKLKRASEATGCTILGKAEFMNPGQSVKDRAARQIILEAEKRGEIKPGGLVVEATDRETARAQVVSMCERLLANPVIEACDIELTELVTNG